MKIFAVTYENWNSGTAPLWRVLPDSSLLKGNNPFFVPDFMEGVTARPAIGFTVGRLGKGITAEYSCRYYGLPFPAIMFSADKLGSHLRNEGKPDTEAYVFDKAVVRGNDTKLDTLNPLALSLEREIPGDRSRDRVETADGGLGDIRPLIDRAVETVSFNNTLKEGDLILIAFSNSGIGAKINTRLRVVLSGTELPPEPSAGIPVAPAPKKTVYTKTINIK